MPNSANSANSANQGGDSNEWEPPIPFHEFALPAFPTDALPPALQDWVLAEAEATQTPPDLPAMLVLPVCAVACAKKVSVQVDADWCEQVNIYSVTDLASGTRKSPVFTDATVPLRQFETEERRRLAPEISVATSLYEIAAQEHKQAQRDAAKAAPEDRESLRERAIELARKLHGMRVPSLPRYLADDSTPESIAILLQQHDGRIGILSDEGGLFDIMAGIYAASGNINLDIYLKGYTGTDYRVDRVTRHGVDIVAPAITIGLAVQPHVLQSLARRPELRGRGLMARFFYSRPVSTVGHRSSRPMAMPQAVRTEYHRVVQGLLGLPWRTDGFGNRIPHTLSVSPEARELLRSLQEWIEPRTAPDGELVVIADWVSKLAGGVARIAGLLHMVTHVDNAAPWDIPIEADTMARAIRIGYYLIPHAQSAHAVMGADPNIEDAKRILRWIKRTDRRVFSRREAFEGTKGHFRRVTALEPGLRVLEEHCHIRQRVAADPIRPGRPPSPVYDVNPYTHSQYSHNSHNTSGLGNSANTANCAKPPDVPTPASNDCTFEDGEVVTE